MITNVMFHLAAYPFGNSNWYICNGLQFWPDQFSLLWSGRRIVAEPPIRHQPLPYNKQEVNKFLNALVDKALLFRAYLISQNRWNDTRVEYFAICFTIAEYVEEITVVFRGEHSFIDKCIEYAVKDYHILYQLTQQQHVVQQAETTTRNTALSHSNQTTSSLLGII